MEQVQNIGQLRMLLAEVRAKRKGFLTNFYLDEVKHGLWIRNRILIGMCSIAPLR